MPQFTLIWNSLKNCQRINARRPLDSQQVKFINSRDRKNYNNYTYYQIISAVESFVLDDFSRTYIKLIRDRTSSDKENVSIMFNHIVSALLRLLAPVAPHITEYVYQGYGKKAKGHKESIHLYNLPVADKSLIDENLDKEMNLVREISQNVLSMRNENNLRLRWVLKSLAIESNDSLIPNLKDVLASMTNVKKVYEVKTKPAGNFIMKELPMAKIYLDKDADASLKEEWELRELIRKIQDKRSDLKLNPNDTVKLLISCDDAKFLDKFKRH